MFSPATPSKDHANKSREKKTNYKSSNGTGLHWNHAMLRIYIWYGMKKRQKKKKERKNNKINQQQLGRLK